MFRFPHKKNDLENFWLSSRLPALALSCRPHGTWSAQSGTTDTSWQQCHGTFSGWSRSWDGALGVGGSSDKMIPWRGRVRNPRKILVHQIEGVTLISLQIIEMFGVGLSKFWKMEFFLVFFFLYIWIWKSSRNLNDRSWKSCESRYKGHWNRAAQPSYSNFV